MNYNSGFLVLTSTWLDMSIGSRFAVIFPLPRDVPFVAIYVFRPPSRELRYEYIMASERCPLERLLPVQYCLPLGFAMISRVRPATPRPTFIFDKYIRVLVTPSRVREFVVSVFVAAKYATSSYPEFSHFAVQWSQVRTHCNDKVQVSCVLNEVAFADEP